MEPTQVVLRTLLKNLKSMSQTKSMQVPAMKYSHLRNKHLVMNTHNSVVFLFIIMFKL